MSVQKLQIEHWTVRVRKPEGEGPHPVMLLLHGWMGDENAMWVFASRLPKNLLQQCSGPSGKRTTHHEKESHNLKEREDNRPAG